MGAMKSATIVLNDLPACRAQTHHRQAVAMDQRSKRSLVLGVACLVDCLLDCRRAAVAY